MKTILLLRHGKSDWGEPGLEDSQRPLAQRGEKDGPRMGKALLQFNVLPDLILSSPAERAMQTAHLVAKACGSGVDIRLADLLYGRGTEGYVEALRSLPPAVRQPLVVGHNPELEDLSGLLGGGINIRIPTAGLVCLQAPVESWTDLQPGTCVLQWFLIPKIVQAIS